MKWRGFFLLLSMYTIPCGAELYFSVGFGPFHSSFTVKKLIWKRKNYISKYIRLFSVRGFEIDTFSGSVFQLDFSISLYEITRKIKATPSKQSLCRLFLHCQNLYGTLSCLSTLFRVPLICSENSASREWEVSTEVNYCRNPRPYPATNKV